MVRAEPDNQRPAYRWLSANAVIGAVPPAIRPIGVGVLCFASALLVQIVLRVAGVSLLFPTYFPAILIAGLLEGLASGLIVVVLSLVAVRWAFTLPPFVFFPVALEQLENFGAYLLSSGCILFVTELYRKRMRELLSRGRERELLVKELEHRGKNTYAVIDVIVRKTLEDEPERANILSGRIRAVKFANDLLNHNASQTVLLKTLLLHEFIPYGDTRFHVEGSDIELSADAGRRLALVFHELVTNAAKYGALSAPGGRVLIAWTNKDGPVKLDWSEEGGPLVQPPMREGFGSRIVGESLKSLSGSFAPTYAPAGLRCTMTFRA